MTTTIGGRTAIRAIGLRKFDTAALAGVTFRGAPLRDVSFRAWDRKYPNAIRTVAFDGARMDKLIHAGLKGMGADLSNVTVA